MAEMKNPVKAPTFKQTADIYHEEDEKTEKKFTRIVPKELRFSRSTPNPTPKLFNSMKSRGRVIRTSRMLIYEDCSDEDEGFRSTPPNIQDKRMGTPGAPIKSRKDFEKKVLRPKKLVYNERGSDNQSEDFEKENQFYQMTPKKSGKKEEDGDLYYEKYLKITAIIPRKIIPIEDNDSGSIHSTNRQLEAENTSSKSVQRDRNKTRNEGSKKKKSSKPTIPKNDLSYNKENNAIKFEEVKNRETEEFSFDLSKNYSVKNGRNKEECPGLNKTHFRI